MRFKLPKNSETIYWTHHAIEKMIQYRLSESRIRRVLHTPHRIEEGIAPKTVAVMQSVGTKKHPKEIWVMFQQIKIRNLKKSEKQALRHKIRIISVWRYPGVTPIRQLPDLPPEEWEILKSGILLE